MAMGILGQLADSTNLGTVYTVPAGKVAVFSIFVTVPGSAHGSVYINNVRTMSSYEGNIEMKGIIGQAGTTVKFQGCGGIVTGYEEDA